MRVPRHLVTLAVGILAGGIVAVGATVAVEAGAGGSSVTAPTWYGCLSKTGALSKVGTVAPTCPAKSTAMSWNSFPADANGTPQCTGFPHVDVDLSGCDLRGIFTVGYDLTGANFSGANLAGANLSSTTLDTGPTNFTGANLSSANLSSTELDGANMTSVDLADANLSGSDDFYLNLTGANLTGAIFEVLVMGNDVSNEGSETWSNTTCPDGTNSNNDGGTCVNHLTPA